MQKTRTYVYLHILLLFYSLGAICSKFAGEAEFLSFPFFMYYGLLLTIMVIYAVFWQQILKVIPLTTAYASKAVTVIWGLVWGMLIFHETLTLQKAIGAGIIMFGIVMVVKADEE